MFGMAFGEVWRDLSGVPFPSKLENAVITEEVEIVIEHEKRIYQVSTATLEQPKGLLLIFTDITELKRLQVKLEHQAYYDELTQIYNRRAFFQKCVPDFEAAKKAASPFTIILMDIDYFKKVNIPLAIMSAINCLSMW
jgi:PleD family two-component response regulator